MAKAIIYSDEDVLAAQQALRAKTARKVGKTRSQVAEFLADDIRKAIEQGYSLKDIKNILAEAGISVSVAKMQAILEGKNQASHDESVGPTKKHARQYGRINLEKLSNVGDKPESEETRVQSRFARLISSRTYISHQKMNHSQGEKYASNRADQGGSGAHQRHSAFSENSLS